MVQLSDQNCLVPKLVDSIMSYFVFIYSLAVQLEMIMRKTAFEKKGLIWYKLE